VYNVMVLCMIGVPIALMLKEQVDASYTLISLFIFFATTLTICLVFIPKVRGSQMEGGGAEGEKYERGK
jgi:gamma-aminobutyric acid type B receptor